MAPAEGGGSRCDGGSSSSSSSSGSGSSSSSGGGSSSSGSAATVSGARGSGGRKQTPSDGALSRVRAALAVSSQGATLLNGSDTDGGSLSSSTGRSGTGSSGGCRQPPGDDASCRVRAGLTCLEPRGTALLNGLDAEGCALRSGAGTGCISTGGGGDMEAGASRGRASRIGAASRVVCWSWDWWAQQDVGARCGRSISLGGGAWMVREKEALAWRQCLRGTGGHQHWPSGAVRGWCGSRRRLPWGQRLRGRTRHQH